MPGTPTDLTRLRITLTAFFALDGFIFAGWVVRIPAIKHQTGAAASALGLALLVFGAAYGGINTPQAQKLGQISHRVLTLRHASALDLTYGSGRIRTPLARTQARAALRGNRSAGNPERTPRLG